MEHENLLIFSLISTLRTSKGAEINGSPRSVNLLSDLCGKNPRERRLMDHGDLTISSLICARLKSKGAEINGSRGSVNLLSI